MTDVGTAGTFTMGDVALQLGATPMRGACLVAAPCIQYPAGSRQVIGRASAGEPGGCGLDDAMAALDRIDATTAG